MIEIIDTYPDIVLLNIKFTLATILSCYCIFIFNYYNIIRREIIGDIKLSGKNILFTNEQFITR